MDGLLYIRQYLGLTQANIADYLSVSVSLVKMVEAGRRELPAAANLKIARLQVAIHASEPPATNPQSPTVKGAPNPLRPLQRYIRQLEKQLQKKEAELQQLAQQYQQALNRILLASKLQNTAPPLPETDIDMLWLELLEAEAKAGLEHSGPAAQAILQWQIDTYIYSISTAKALLEKNSATDRLSTGSHSV